MGNTRVDFQPEFRGAASLRSPYHPGQPTYGGSNSIAGKIVDVREVLDV